MQNFRKLGIFVFLFTIFGIVFVYFNKLENVNIGQDTSVVNQDSSCSIIQDNAHSRIKNTKRKITEGYKEVHNIQVTEALFVTEPKHLLGYCHVPKVASTLWMSNFAEMNMLDQTMIEEKLKAMSLHDYLFSKFSKSYPKNNDDISKLFTFVFMRHPFERLVSAFHDKFVTVKQLNLMEPFIKYYLKTNGVKDTLILNKPWVQRHVNVTFENFVRFVLHENSINEKISGPSWHWWPFSDICKLTEIDYSFIGKLESLEEDVECILKHFPDYFKLQVIRSKLKAKVNAKGHHNKDMTMEYFSQLSKNVIKDLYKMYEVDFLMGGYEYPQAYIEIGRDSL